MAATHGVAPITPDRDDAAVIEQSWQEPERFAVIFDLYFAEIHRYVARRLDTQVADDIAAETFLIAFRQRERYDLARSNARPWLYGIATRLVGRHRRNEERRYRALARSSSTEHAGSHEDRVEASVSARQLRADLARALTKLSSRDRDAFLLVALGELSYNEVAEALEIPNGTVGSRLSRARRILRKALGGVNPVFEPEVSDG